MTVSASGDEHVQLRLGLYVLGALSADDHIDVEEHLVQCASCRAESADLNEVCGFLDLLTPEDIDALARDFRPDPRDPDSAVSTPTPQGTPPSMPAPVPRPRAGRAAMPRAAGTAPRGRRAERAAPAGTAPAAGRRAGLLGGHPVRIVLSAVALALVLGVGVGVWLKSGSPVAVTLAGSETNSATGVSMSVSVVGRGSGSHVDASVKGLIAGGTYQLYAVDAHGGTVTVARWVADDGPQTVAGDIQVRTEDLAFFSVATAGGGVVVTVRVTKSDGAGAPAP